MKTLNLHTRQYVKVKTVEKSSAWLVVAILVEERGNELFALSEPRILKIIPKVRALALSGKVSRASISNTLLALPGIHTVLAIAQSIISPFVSYPLRNNTASTIVWFGARPPTYSF